ncbi:MAG: Sulfide dehydrogenase subunit alpha [Methanonatronarchaeales archaeon]|nr:Sulfide dehydrogenase subunit alpha [Methanonatronarchaeales archaeon]MBS1264020.1 Sulfide dehydrogenase subunit alpha [Methanonatronarchaeales archaeon]
MLDVAIIGAGPAGLTAAVYAARGNRETAVFGDAYDSQLARGGTFDNFPGYPDGVLGLDLAEEMLEQARQYGAETVDTRVEGLSREDGFTLDTETGSRDARAVILATGAEPRSIGIEGEERFEHRGLSLCAYCDGPTHRDEPVAVVGFGNGAAKAAIQLKEVASRVYLLSTEESLRSERVYERRLEEAGNVEVFLGVEPTALRGEDSLEAFDFEAGGENRSVEVDGVFVEFGREPRGKLADDVGAELTGRGYVCVDRPSMETPVDGFFAAGDVAGGMKQAATAVGDGASAAISAMNYLEE